MTIGNTSRCPTCGRPADVASLSYSTARGDYVCPACRAGEDAAPHEGASALGDVEVSYAASHAASQAAATAAAASGRQPSASSASSRSVAGVVIGVVVLVTIGFAVVLAWRAGTGAGSSASAPSSVAAGSEDQRAWDNANHARVVALKSEAEALALDGKLREAHAKYREVDKLVGGRTIKDPRLSDLVEVSRQDQDKVYKILLQQMELGAGAQGQQQQQRQPRATLQPPARAPAAEGPSAAAVNSAPAATLPAAVAGAAGAAGAAGDAPRAASPVAGRAPVAAAAAAAGGPASAPAMSAPAGADGGLPPNVAQTLGVPRGLVTDEQVGDAIQRGVDFLLAHFKDGRLAIDETSNPMDYAGLNALCVYALANSGRAISDTRLNPKGPEMTLMLDRLKAMKIETSATFDMPVTYGRSLRACALAAVNRPQDRQQLEDDVDWLINAPTEGAYTYDDRYAPERPLKPKKKPLATRPAPAARAPRPGWYDGEPLWPTPLRPTAAPTGADVILTDGTYTPRPAPPPPPPPPPPAPGRNITMPRTTFPRNFQNRLPTAPRAKYSSPTPWDNSNSQYGLLGVWAGAEVGIEVPDAYWRQVQKHWTEHQLPSGEWNYIDQGEAGRFAMTVAGVASLLVTHDYLDAPLLGRAASAEPYPQPLSAGLAWLEDGDNSVNVEAPPLHFLGYNLFGLERVALASGFKQFGAHDWFVTLTVNMLRRQAPDGNFGNHGDVRDALIDTAYYLLFLSRGRHPIMMNKLRHDDFWTNRPRELANLSGFASRELERPLNWQVVDVTREAYDWADAPILYIASHKPINFDDVARAKLMDFVDNGGIIFTHADLGSEEFNRFAAQLAKQCFPAYELKDLPADHALYKLNYNIKLPRPRLQGVSNGSRLLMVHAPTDLSVAWQQRAFVSKLEVFRLGMNLYLYATGKERFRNRLDTPVIPTPPQEATNKLPMALLKYDGNWNPEPGAWARQARRFVWELDLELNIKVIDVAQVSSPQFRVAHLTGTAAYAPGDAEIAALRQFVEGGGTLLIDAAGGSGAFADAADAWLPKVLGGAKLEPVAASDPLLKRTIDGTVDAPEKALRLYAMEQLRSDAPRLRAAKVGKGRVVFSALDITSGLLATNTWGILGYLPEYCEAVVRNLVVTAQQP